MIGLNIHTHPKSAGSNHNACTQADDRQQSIEDPGGLKDLLTYKHQHKIDKTDGQQLIEAFMHILRIGITIWQLHISDKQIQELNAAERNVDHRQDTGCGNGGNGAVEGPFFLLFYSL